MRVPKILQGFSRRAGCNFCSAQGGIPRSLQVDHAASKPFYGRDQQLGKQRSAALAVPAIPVVDVARFNKG